MSDLASTSYHAPVLVDEVVRVLGAARRVLDCTVGGGGHTLALLAAGVAEVVGIDRDPEALSATAARLGAAGWGGRFRPVAGEFGDVARGAPGALGTGAFDGVLADLGVSSHQLDADERGFSFRPGVPLDMRMAMSGETAAALLMRASADELARIFREYGDEPRARRLAREVVRRRERRPFVTADDLVAAIRGALGATSGPGDFARLFQAVRIAVNGELESLAVALPALRERLAPAGRLAVITYHSGEDRIVKHAMRAWSVACRCPPRQPVCTCGGRAPGAVLTPRGITAAGEEIAANPRARSARLRVWERAGHTGVGPEPARAARADVLA